MDKKKALIFETPQKFFRMTKYMNISYRINKRLSKSGKYEWLRRKNCKDFKPRLIVVINISKTLPIDNTIKAIMQELDIIEKLSCKLVIENEENITKLLTIQNYITFGYISRKYLKDLLFKRGNYYDSSSDKLCTINDNEIIEQYLGQYDIICLEDIIDELFKLRKNVDKVLGFIANFKLDMPEHHYLKNDYTKMYQHGGEYGDRKEDINKLLEKIL
eukprot:Mrub_08875.p1 GENE.Mrub_08875~~Mrub_08875.p1  ORF type:complete len:247 (+),score=33.52 Mrub_08875:91-741(+)